MPIYDYKCRLCKLKIELFLKKVKDDKDLLKCNICEKLSLERIISKSSFILKGNGWYVTDFKDKKK